MTEGIAYRRVIISAFLLVIVIMVAITATGLLRIKYVSGDLERIVRERDVQIALMNRMRTAARERALILQSMMIVKDPFIIDDYAMQMSKMALQYIQARKKLLRHPLSPEERKLLDEQHRQTVKTGDSQTRIIDDIRNEEYPPATAQLLYTTLPGMRHSMAMMDQFITIKRQQNLADLNATSRTIKQTYRIMIVLGILGVLFSIGVAGFVSRRINREIMRRRSSENELRHSELRERTIRENIIDGVLTLNAKGLILTCNKACTKMFGYEREAMVGQSASILIPTPVHERARYKLAHYLQRWAQGMQGSSKEVTGRHANGSDFPAELDISTITLDGEPLYIAVIRDISEKKKAELRLQQFNMKLEQRVIERTDELARTNEQLRHEIKERIKAQFELTHMANHDSLTGLPNRAMFNQHLELILHHDSRHDHQLALMFMDLDGFKTINDTLGHEVGDRLLIELSRQMSNCLRKEDMLARMGGDEFTILLSELKHKDDASRVADKLIKTVNRPVQIGKFTCHVGISIGISLYPADSESADTLLRQADDAMYEAKNAGKNTFRYYSQSRALDTSPALSPAH